MAVILGFSSVLPARVLDVGDTDREEASSTQYDDSAL